MLHRLTIAGCALLMATPAHAHGEEALVSIYAQALAVVATLIVLRLIPALRIYKIPGSLGCIVGVVIAWVATGWLPYIEHRHLITFVHAFLPVLIAGGAVYLAQRHAQARRTSKSLIQGTNDEASHVVRSK